MITLLLTVVAAGAANVALVAFLADRLGPKAGAAVSAGEFVAVAETAPASAKRSALKVGNENVRVGGAQRAA
ncbi:MAG: hypothetical protein K2Y56_14180 [Methylobacterium sp.]|uniref:hypothetical protein n=1 Tax=Methylobacterium sp. TaxID=409 RepID=UPI0025E709CE|nr:hypothetical protein [Methylobacterium sp.]MBX9932667.1 hypothetical protein [Methylobacterium sp.]